MIYLSIADFIFTLDDDINHTHTHTYRIKISVTIQTNRYFVN